MKRHDRCSVRLVSLFAALSVLPALGGCGKEPKDESGAAPAARAPTTPPAEGRTPAPPVRGSGAGDAMVVANERGVGLMGQFAYAPAVDAFTEAVGADGDALDVQVNLAIATFNRQFDGDEEAGLAKLREVLAKEPSHLRAKYCAALLLLRGGEVEPAGKMLVEVAEADPLDPYAAYFAGQSIEAGDQAGALAWYERAMKRDPYLRSAYFRSSSVLRRMGRGDEAQAMLEIFTRLDGNPRARTVEFVYTKMGPKAEVLSLEASTDSARPRPEGPLFARAIPLVSEHATWETDSHETRSITSADIDGDGTQDLFVTQAMAGGDVVNAVILQEESGAFRLERDHLLAGITDVRAALWGDLDNDGLMDAYFCRRGPNQLWRQAPAGTWTEIGQVAGATAGDLDTVDGMLADFDHDGDLDMLVVNADGPSDLLSNNADGSFRSLGAETGLAAAGAGGRAVIAADFDGSRDLDFLVLRSKPPHHLALNDRLWSYRVNPPSMEALWRADIAHAVAADHNADGRTDLATLDGEGRLSLWSRDDAGSMTGQRISDAPVGSAARLAVADLDGDGRLSLIRGDGHVWEMRTGDGFASVEGDALPSLGGVGRVDWNLVALGRGGWSLITHLAGEAPSWHAPGAGRFGIHMLRVSGRTDVGKSMRSNVSGVGAWVTVRLPDGWTRLDSIRASSQPGQSHQLIPVGTGGHESIRHIVIDWSDGVRQTEMHGVAPGPEEPPRTLVADAIETIAETQRQVGSCPILFAWNGTSHEFVTDLLGVGGIGFLVEPGVTVPSRPWENLLLDEDQLRARDGVFDVRLLEPMEEVVYLDAASLAAWDLPPGWSMVLDERCVVEGPNVTGDAIFYREELPIALAVNGRGTDVTSELAHADHAAAPLGALDRRFIGRLAQEETLEIVFSRPISSLVGAPVLVIDGWIEYPYSQTMFAAWQARAPFDAPTLEVLDASGSWQPLAVRWGYPAGMPRRCTLPLAGVPDGATTLRMRTNQEIYWDRLSIVGSEPCPEARRVDLPLVSAELIRRGFPRRSTHAQARPDYEYSDRRPMADMRHPRGLYTEFGAVEDLAGEVDGSLVTFGPGEEIALGFGGAALAEHPPQWKRFFVARFTGWCKDMDLYTQTGDTVEPIPAHESLGDRDQPRRTRYASPSTSD